MRNKHWFLAAWIVLVSWYCGSAKEQVKETPQESAPAQATVAAGGEDAAKKATELNKQLAKAVLRYFPVAKAEVSSEAWQKWSKASSKIVANALNNLPAGYVLQITGHCDPRGDDAYNDNLSVERAQFVKDQLSKEGISSGKITIKGEGKRKLANPANPTSGENRRVEFLVVKQ
ncbi:MAG: OmpA family protein [Leptospiraceae bacterium]|nr:OmpA family protein [Leptospiraceae bacterium]MDW8307448.1 OmpA family protein [Leptospiraceae bacterium]